MKTVIACVAFTLAFALLLLSQPLEVAGQNQPNQDKEKKQKVEEEDDDDDDVGPEERKAVKISLEDARSIALKEVEGKIVDEELEKEHGRLQYAFDIKKSDGRMFDVEIDAITGEVLQAIEEDEDDDDDDVRSSKERTSKKTDAKVANKKPQ